MTAEKISKKSSKPDEQNSHGSGSTSLTLYRKYRPQNFDEVVGQESAVQTLKGAIKSGNVTHAYLFTGGRGTGKTSLARIFARALETSENDIYEIDAASNRGIDDVRELREGVSVLPFESRYKVYIIDEVHMLTKEAFNALLKTLEEPPKHAMFILATTELEKLPPTIISRCQVLQFKKPSISTLSQVVMDIGAKEGKKIERAAAELISLVGDGSFRDTLGTLQKVLTQNLGNEISYDEVVQTTGTPSGALIDSFIAALVSPTPEKLLDGMKAVEIARERNIDAKIFLDMIAAKIRAQIMARIEGGVAQSAQKNSDLNSSHLVSILETYSYIGLSGSSMLPLELALLKAEEKFLKK